jgi:hypothetical protein
MPNIVALDEEDAQRLRSLQSQMHACLAMNRVTLQALAILSPTVRRAALAALADETAAAPSDEASQMLAEARVELSRPEAARVLERALIRAAETAPAARRNTAA